jgi:hypothetical protein
MRNTAGLERRDALARCSIPDLDRLIVRRRRESCRIVRPSHGIDSVAMPLERLSLTDVQILSLGILQPIGRKSAKLSQVLPLSRALAVGKSYKLLVK